MRDPHINPATGVWDDNYYANQGRFGGGGGIPTFSFDYAKAAEEAYGEMGPYYLRLLTESRGDMNKALARLTEDYDRGIRNQRVSFAAQQQEAERQSGQERTNIVANALARGLYQKSNFDPQGGFGIPTQNLNEQQDRFAYEEGGRKRALSQYEEEATIAKKRQEVDLPEEQRRREFALEQERREKSASLAEQRGARAYQDFQAKQLGNPDLI